MKKKWDELKEISIRQILENTDPELIKDFKFIRKVEFKELDQGSWGYEVGLFDSDNKLQFFGRVEEKDGGVYEGMFKDGEKHGFGRYISE